MSDPKVYQSVCEETENGDLLIPIPQALLDKLGLRECDQLKIDVDDKGQIILRKA